MGSNRDADQARGSLEEQLAQQTALTELLEHVLDEGWRIKRQMQPGPPPALLPGSLPQKLPVAVPVPEESRIIGSVVESQQISIYFEFGKKKEDLLQFYEQRLLSQGWKKPDMPDMFAAMGGSGFTRNWPNIDMGTGYCFGETGLSLNVKASASGPNTTTAHLTLNLDPAQSPCSPSQRRHFEQMEMSMSMGKGKRMSSVLPAIEPPPNSSQTGGGGGSGNGYAHTDGGLKTDLDLPAIMAHYNAQLTKVGWKEASGGQSGPVGWSAWDFPIESEQWHGMLTIIERPWSKGSYGLRLDAQIEGNTDADGISTSFNQFY